MRNMSPPPPPHHWQYVADTQIFHRLIAETMLHIAEIPQLLIITISSSIRYKLSIIYQEVVYEKALFSTV